MKESQYQDALNLVAEIQQVSASLLQRKMRVGYTTAAEIVNRMETEGHIGPYNGSKPREVHIPKPEGKAKAKKETKPAQRKTAAKGKGKTKTPKKEKTPQKATQEPEKPKSRKGIGGRKPLWYELDMPSKLDSVTGWTMQGATMEELADMLGVGKTTLYEWRSDYPEFADALRAGRHVSNGELLNAAFRNSTGFKYTEREAVRYKTYEEFRNPKTGEMELKSVEKVKVVDVERFVPANANLLQFMLTNRLPDQYKKKEHVEHAGSIGQGDYGYMTDEELDAALNELEGGSGGGDLDEKK